MKLERILDAVEEIDPDLFEELNGADARLELDDLKRRAGETDTILVNGETVADHYAVVLEERKWNSMRLVESSEPIVFVTLKSGTAPQRKPITESLAEQPA